MIKKYLVLALSLGVMACSQHSEPNDNIGSHTTSHVLTNPTQQSLSHQLPAYSWQLVNATNAKNQRIDSLFVRADMPLTLNFQNNRISVLNSCNNMSGTFDLSGNNLTTKNIASTMMACATPLDQLDRQVSQLIAGKTTVEINPKQANAKRTPELTLTTTQGDTLTFKGIATPETLYGSKAETIFLEIAPETKTCSAGTRQMDCLQIKEVNYDEKGLKTYSSSQWLNFYDNIEGYKHNSNEKVIIRVKKYAVKNPPADASGFAYVLDTTIEQERVK